MQLRDAARGMRMDCDQKGGVSTGESMRAIVRRDCVVDGSVRRLGEVVDTDRRTVERLELRGEVERFEYEWNDEPPVSTLTTEIRDVMVFTPVYRLEPETVQAIFEMEWAGPLSVVFQRDNPGTDGRFNHLHQYQRGRELFLQGRYEAMLVIESDIIPPRDTLARLAALRADCAYGVYRFRVSNVINIYERYPDKDGVAPRNIGESLSLKPYLLKRAVKLGKYQCSGAGLGCVLIRRRVLEAFDFRLEESAHCDTYWNRDVMRHGFVQTAEMGVICGHKGEDGRVLWPEIKGKG